MKDTYDEQRYEELRADVENLTEDSRGWLGACLVDIRTVIHDAAYAKKLLDRLLETVLDEEDLLDGEEEELEEDEE